MELVIGIGAIAVIVVYLLIVHRLEATTRRPLPVLDPTPRTATAVALHEAPLGLRSVEVEFADGAGTLRRARLVDLFDSSAAQAFTMGSQWQVYGFMKAPSRCLLTEAHDDVPRSGYDLDGLRIGREHMRFPARPGSPVLGVMRFAGVGFFDSDRVIGARTSWPADPASAWAQAQVSARPMRRPRPLPPVRSTEDVGREDVGLHRTVTWGAPIFWVVLALAFTGLLVYAQLDGDEIDPLLWVAAGVALLVTVGILLFRATFYPRWNREGLEHELNQGTLCDVVDSPLSFPGGDVDSTTAIAVDVDLPPDHAARIVEALRLWASRDEAREAWGQEPGWLVYRVLTSAELFGEAAAGGFIVRDCPAEPGEWLLVSPAQGGDYPDAPYRDGEVTRITFPKQRRGQRQ